MRILKLFSVAVCLLLCGDATAQSFDQITRPVATLTDPVMMQEVLGDLLIFPPDDLTSVQLVDITGNGYGPDDLLIVNPTLDVHYLGDFLPQSLRSLIAQWEFEADFRYDITREVTTEDFQSAHLREDAAASIAGACVTAIDAHYTGDDISLRLDRDGGSVRVELWGYDEDALHYGGASGDLQCEINRQKFEFASPIQIQAFREPGQCIEAWTENGVVSTRDCPAEM